MKENNKNKKIIIIGAGPGGLVSGMLLASKGYQVEIFEKLDQPGGRMSEIKINNYKFDVGPTFLMMKFVLDEIFAETLRKTSDYLDFIKLSPMYRIYYKKDHLDVYSEDEKMAQEIKRVFPGEEKEIYNFKKKERERYEKLTPILFSDNNNILDVFSKNFLKAIRSFSLGNSLYNVLGKYFKDERLKISFTFQSKYLGMSPWNCPGAFAIIPYVEHVFGIYHVKGGLSEISRQMARVIEESGGKIYYNSQVSKIIVENKKALGVKLKNGKEVRGDKIIINADFGYAATNLFEKGILKKYSAKKLKKKDLSCSTLMIYLGIKKQYKLPHNTIVLANNYKKNIEDIFKGKLTENDISFYLRDHSLTDPKLAEEGKTALYILVPVPNLRGKIDWQESKKLIRKWVINSLKDRLGMTDIEENIEVEKIYTPLDWLNDYNVFEGAVFNLSHKLSQMIWFRPHNKFEEIDNVYLTGGGTHPGSGLPTIWHSGKIAAKLIDQIN